ncbi:MAG: glycosyltransferase family 2 protein [Bacteriovoracaceae bacterium]|nr:glycosyltransferase family 2 protein [Bacteriovoracaceae bacterium]
MKISVIIPTYNRERTILRALESVKAQSFAPFECWVVDDGSTDKTEELVNDFIQTSKLANFFYLKTENRGVSAARNLGVIKSIGEWVAFLDSDDEWLPQKLAEQKKFMESNPELELVFTDEIWFRNSVKVNQKKKHQKSGGDLFERSMEQCLIGPSTVLMKKALFLKLGGFREDFPVCEDYDLWLKTLSQFSVGYLPQALINKYGGHTDQLSSQAGMDYYRVKALYSLLETLPLTDSQAKHAQALLQSKGKILLAGYEKYQNFQHQKEVEAMLSPSRAEAFASLV